MNLFHESNEYMCSVEASSQSTIHYLLSGTTIGFWSLGRCVCACVVCASQMLFFSACVCVLLSLGMSVFNKLFKSCYYCANLIIKPSDGRLHHQHQHNELHCNHLYLPAVKRLAINVFDMQNKIQSQPFGVIISCQNIDVFLPQKQFFAQLDLNHIQINHSRNSLGSLLLGSLGSAGVSQKRAAEEGLSKTTMRSHVGEISKEREGQKRSKSKLGGPSYRHDSGGVVPVPVPKPLKHPIFHSLIDTVTHLGVGDMMDGYTVHSKAFRV